MKKVPKKEKKGRPKLSEDNKRSIIVKVGLTPSEHDLIEGLQKDYGYTYASEAIRHATLMFCQIHKNPAVGIQHMLAETFRREGVRQGMDQAKIDYMTVKMGSKLIDELDGINQIVEQGMTSAAEEIKAQIGGDSDAG